MLGNNIKKYRELNRLSINALAKKCNISPGYLSDLEKGKKENPSIDTLEKISLVLEVTIKQLFDEDTNSTDEITELEQETNILYSKLKNLSQNDRKKIIDIINEFEKENDN